MLDRNSDMYKVLEAGYKEEQKLAKKLKKPKNTKEKFLAANAKPHDGISN